MLKFILSIPLRIGVWYVLSQYNAFYAITEMQARQLVKREAFQLSKDAHKYYHVPTKRELARTGRRQLRQDLRSGSL
jgi:3-methyladenine DNA glycosylase/8-oxoguanine DNA glycosylase